MANPQLITSVPFLPRAPQSLDEVLAWAQAVNNAVQSLQEPGTIELGVLDSVTAKRVQGFAATAIAAGDVALHANWGTTPGTVVAGTDQRGQLSITTGTTPGANPTVILTFADGVWTTAPFALVVRTDGLSDLFTVPITWVTSTAALTITLTGTPVAGVYKFAYIIWG